MLETRFKVDFEPVGKRVEVKPGLTLLDAARQAGLALTSDCGGAGSCGQCKVIAREQRDCLSQPSLTEQAILEPDELNAGYRLACQADVLGDVKIDVPASSLVSGQRLQVEGRFAQPALAKQTGLDAFEDQVVRSYLVSVPEASLHDLRSDLQRVLDGLAEQHHCFGLSAGPAAVRSLSPLLRKHAWQVTALVRDDTIVDFLAPEARPTGLAIDLGTTKVAGYLVDLATGETLAAEGRPNPQIGYGEDVISRLVYVRTKPEGGKALAQAVYSTLSELAQTLTTLAGVSMREIAETCIVGNTAMTHLLLELPTDQLALAPYVPASATPQEICARDIGLPFAADGRVYVPPCVAGYVGADLVAMTLASGIGNDGRSVLGIDIGTNTEIILSSHGSRRMVSLSCASGPAFEGAHIRAGMRAASGAIECVHLNGGKPALQTIAGVPPVGICGSGIIDAIAELRRVGALNQRGRFQAGSPGVRSGKDGLEYLLAQAHETGTGEDIVITQHDVDEILFAKGAIMAGIKVLLEVGGLQTEALDEIVLAGAFGTYLNLDTAISIGLLPDIPLDHYRQVGNAAGEGARRIVLSKAERAAANEIARRIDYIELSVYPGFRSIYAKSMRLEA